MEVSATSSNNEKRIPSRVHFQAIDALTTLLSGHFDLQGQVERVRSGQTDGHEQLPEVLLECLLWRQGRVNERKEDKGLGNRPSNVGCEPNPRYGRLEGDFDVGD